LTTPPLQKNTMRILFLADTHIGYDWPLRPRIQRRRRGDDFYNNFLQALQPALEKQVDLVIHGGDLLHRSRLPAAVVSRAFQPLLEVADQGIPVYVVPGNHERSAFRLTLFERHPLLHLFDRPRVYHFVKDGSELVLCGFPFIRGDIRSEFAGLVNRLVPQGERNKTVLLCTHHPFDGARVGPQNFTFYRRADTIDPGDLPPWVDVVLCGHIHRRQVLRFRKKGNEIPVYYPGSVERTSFAEKDEDKGYIMLSVTGNGSASQRSRIAAQFIDLPARPMHRLEWDAAHCSLAQFKEEFAGSIVKIVLHNLNGSALQGKLSAAMLRKMAPASMNVELAVSGPIRSNIFPENKSEKYFSCHYRLP
jgi:exonuclease SbcD